MLSNYDICSFLIGKKKKHTSLNGAALNVNRTVHTVYKTHLLLNVPDSQNRNQIK